MFTRDHWTHALLRLLDRIAPAAGRDRRLARYLDDVAARELRVPQAIGRHQRVAEGRTSIVRRWETDRHGVLFARAWKPSRTECPARSHRTVNELVARSRFAVPAIVHLDDSLKTAVRWRLEVAIEAEAAGRPLADLLRNSESQLSESERICHVLGEHLASLHALAGPAWGTPWLASNEMMEPKLYWRNRLQLLSRRLKPAVRLLKAAHVDTGLGRLAGRIDTLPFDRPALVHGDLAMTHVFVDWQGDRSRLALIDLATVHYGHPAEDLSMLRGNVLGPGGFDRLMQAYRNAGGMDDPRLIEAVKVFGQVRLWEKLNSRVGQLLRIGKMTSKKRLTLESEQEDVEMKLRALMEHDIQPL